LPDGARRDVGIGHVVVSSVCLASAPNCLAGYVVTIT
jgi:hypothetical protein